MTDRQEEKSAIDLTQDIVYLRAVCDFTTDAAFFSYSLDGRNWQQLGGGFPMVFSIEHFTGNRFALFNYATREAGGLVDIDWFHFRK